MASLFARVTSAVAERGVPVHAKLTVGEPKHRFAPPTNLRDRKKYQLELLSYVEKHPTLMPPKASAEFESIFGKPGAAFQLVDLERVNGVVKTLHDTEDSTKLKDIPEIVAIAPVKDQEINLRQFRRVLEAAHREKEGRQAALQAQLHISNDDLSVKNLKKYLANVDKEISEKSNYWDVENRDIDDEIVMPRLTHKELAIKRTDEDPTTFADMLAKYQRAVESRFKKVTIEECIGKLFPTAKYDLLLSQHSPMQTGHEMAAIEESIIRIMDMLTDHQWENNYTLLLLRSVQQVMLVGLHGKEKPLVQRALPTYRHAVLNSTNQNDEVDE